MTRETKLNLGFLIAFLVISLPGAAILFAKFLNPSERYLAEPPHVRKTATYVNPPAAAPGVRRVVGEVTAAWVADLATADGAARLTPVLLGGRIHPLISEDRTFEVISLVETEAGPRLRLVLWARELGTGEAPAIEVEGAGPVAGLRTLPVPPEVVIELKRGGFTVPPETVRVAEVALEDGARPERLALRWTTRARDRGDVVDLSDAVWPEERSGSAPATIGHAGPPR